MVHLRDDLGGVVQGDDRDIEDDAANDADKPSIHAADSAVKVYVIKTDEQLMMVRHVKSVLSPAAPPKMPATPKP